MEDKFIRYSKLEFMTQELFQGKKDYIFVDRSGLASYYLDFSGILIPGSFNPLHHGHIGMMKSGLKVLKDSQVLFELSISNVDKPDLDMNTLVSLSRKTLFNQNNVGMRMPRFLGVLIGYFFDLIGRITRTSLPISSIRVKKFMETTQFSSSINKTDFVAPFSLREGLSKTLNYEFIEDNSDSRTFKTE